MNFKCDCCMAYVINDIEDGCFISDCNGFIMEAYQMIDIGKKLIATAKQKGMRERLELHNKKRKIELEDELHPKYTKEKPKKKRKAYVYLMECNGKYKIGVAKDVERRRKQLQISSPYEIKIIETSALIENAYKEEEELHEYYAKYSIGGEWFDLPEREVLDIIVYFNQGKWEEEEYEVFD